MHVTENVVHSQYASLGQLINDAHHWGRNLGEKVFKTIIKLSKIF